MMENYYIDADGMFLSSAPANPGSLPPRNAVRQPPPPSQPGFRPVWDREAGAWALRPERCEEQDEGNGDCAVDVSSGGPADGSDNGAAESIAVASLRESAYRAEADPLRDMAAAYELEARAWRLSGQAARARAAEQKYLAFLARYLEAKRIIRARFPDADAVDDNDALVADNGSTGGGRAAEAGYFFLTARGTYHRSGCRHAIGEGRWVAATALLADPRKRKPCAVCRPVDGEG